MASRATRLFNKLMAAYPSDESASQIECEQSHEFVATFKYQSGYEVWCHGMVAALGEINQNSSNDSTQDYGWPYHYANFIHVTFLTPRQLSQQGVELTLAAL